MCSLFIAIKFFNTHKNVNYYVEIRVVTKKYILTLFKKISKGNLYLVFRISEETTSNSLIKKDIT